jgi:predicted nucleic acid-binding protein
VIVLDASVLIAHLESADAHHDRATDLLLEHADEPMAASVVTVAEVLVGAERIQRRDVGVSALASLGLVRVAVTTDHPERLSDLRARTRLKLPDCCVLLAAEVVDGRVATFDDRLAAHAAEMGRGVRTG